MVVPLLTAVCVAFALGSHTCVSFSRRKCESAVCVECVFFRRRFARPSARRRSAHSLNS